MAPSEVPARSDQFAIASLIADRRPLGVSRAELVRRLGYRNIAKGLRRLDALCAGEFRLTKDLIRALPAALDVSELVVESAVEELREAERRQAADQEAAWRAGFTPHAIALTERTTPSPIFVAALTNATKFMRIDLDLTADPTSFVDQALLGLHRTLAARGWDGFPGFGRPTGVVVNYAPDHAVRFDLHGNALEVLPHAYRLGQAQIFVGGRPIPSGLFPRIITGQEIDDLP